MRAEMVACTVAGTVTSARRAAYIGTAFTGENVALSEVAHQLLGEERISGGSLADLRGQSCYRCVRAEQLCDQRGCL